MSDRARRISAIVCAAGIACSSSREEDGANRGATRPGIAERAPGPSISAAPSSAAPASPRPASARSPATSDAAREPGCRVMSIAGAASRDGEPVRAGDKLSSRSALELDAGGTLRLTHTASARQWTVVGPARFVACDAGAEELAIGRGTVRLEPGAGVRPGAEVWLGTPFGSVRYSDARGEVDVTPQRLELRVAGGQLWFTPLAGESPKERRVAGPAEPARGGAASDSVRFVADAPRASEELALARCAHDARQAEQRARALLAPASEALGVRAAEHVRARQQAHASCISAFARLLAAEPGATAAIARSELAPGNGRARADASARWTELAGYETMWRRVPEPAEAPARD